MLIVQMKKIRMYQISDSFFANKKARTANIAILAFNIQNTDQAPVYARGSRPDGCLDMWYFLYFDWKNNGLLQNSISQQHLISTNLGYEFLS